MSGVKICALLVKCFNNQQKLKNISVKYIYTETLLAVYLTLSIANLKENNLIFYFKANKFF